MQRSPGLASPIDPVARLHERREHPVLLDDADGEADEVELARLHGVGVLGHLAAEQRAAGLAAAVGDARDELVDHLGDELPDGDVVEEEERLGALAAMSSTHMATQSMPMVS